MEIRKYTDIVGVVVTEDIVEGRMVLLTTNTPGGYDFGSRTDLPGVKLPDTEAEANDAKFCVTWTVNNATSTGPVKLFVPQPSFDYALRRGGWDQSANVPFSATVHLTWPGNRDSVAIPSGFQALAFDRGVFRVPSGQFIYSAALQTPGAKLSVANAGDDTAAEAGKLQEQSGVETVIAVVEQYNSTDGSLTFRTL
jgi:hypothetical protein